MFWVAFDLLFGIAMKFAGLEKTIKTKVWFQQKKKYNDMCKKHNGK